jgi:phosphoglycolate phosphatase-like HAD superfamily hydrolase
MSIGLVLDLDGTLVDSHEGRAQAWVEALAENGYRDVGFGEVRALLGLPPDALLLRTIGFGEDSAIGARIRDRYHHNFRVRYLPRMMPFLHGPELLYRFRSIEARIVVVSPDKPDALESLLDLLNARPLIKYAVTADRAPGIKTHRDLVRAAVERLGGGTTLMLADAPHDVEAARQNGVPVVALASGGFPRAALRGATSIYEDASALFSAFDHSPFMGGGLARTA